MNTDYICIVETDASTLYLANDDSGLLHLFTNGMIKDEGSMPNCVDPR
jgi:hypothetical protein